MTETVAQVFVSLRRRQWLLPWISIVFVPVSLTYAMNAALTGSWGIPYGRPAVSIAPPAPEVYAYDKAVLDLRDSCISLFGSYNFWLYDSGRRGPCGLGVAVRADPPSGR